MYLKHKIYIHLLLLVLVMSPALAMPFLDKVRNFFSFSIPENILEKVNKNIIGSLQAKNIRFYLPTKIEMDDVAVLDGAGQTVLSSPHVSLSISLISLLTKNITIANAHVSRPHFYYQIKNGIHNVVQAFEPRVPTKNGESSNFRVSINHVVAENGTFKMEHDAGVTIFAHGIEAEGKFYIENGPFGVDISQATINNGSIKVAGMDLPITDLEAHELHISEKLVSAAKLNALYEKAKISGSGTVFIEKESYDIKATIDAPKNTYPKGLTPLPFTPPAFKAAVKMSGPLVDPFFEVFAELGAIEFKKLEILRGKLKTNFNSHQVNIQSSQFKIGAKGELSAEGKIDLEQNKFSFTSHEKNILSADLSRFLGLTIKSTGLLNATTKLSGNLSGKKTPVFHLLTKGHWDNGSLDHVNLSKKTGFDLDIDFTLDGSLNIHRAKVSDPLGLRIFLDGRANYTQDYYIISYKIKAPSLKRYLPTYAKDIDAHNIFTDGHLSYNKNSLGLSGRAEAESLISQGMQASNLSFDYALGNDEFLFSKIKSNIYDGFAEGNFSIKKFGTENQLSGDIIIDGLDLKKVAEKFSETNFEGIAQARVNMGGSLSDPKIIFNAEVAQAKIDKISVQSTEIAGEFANNIITIPKMRSLDRAGILTGEKISFDVKSQKIAGSFYVTEASLGLLLSEYFTNINGTVSGPIHVSGTLFSPEISAPLKAHNIILYGQKLGSGVFSLLLRKELLLRPESLSDLVFSLSTALEFDGGENRFRIAYALNKKTLNAAFDLTSFLFDSSVLPIESPIGLKAKLSGLLSAEGPLDQLNLSTDILAEDLHIFNPSLREEAIEENYGSAELKVFLNRGVLDLDLCVALKEQLMFGQCVPKPGLALSLKGPFNLSAYDLKAQATIDHDHLEQIFPFLQKELASVSAAAKIEGRLSQVPEKAPTFSSNVELSRLEASLPNVEHIELLHPISFLLTEKGLSLHQQAIFSFAPGNLAISGSFNTKHIDLDLQGAIPLVLARFFVPIIQRADGLAMGRIKISGKPKAPILEGEISPQPSSLITFNKWLESMEFRSGEIIFKKSSKRSFITELNNLKLSLGDGRLLIKGLIDKQYGGKKRQQKTIFDVQVEGSNIVIKDGNQFVEADFDIKTFKNENEEPKLGGNITITDGSVYRQFDLRNFVAQSTAQPSTMSLKFLEGIPMNMDLEVSVRQFKAAARMLNIDIETILTGHLRALGPLNHPKVSGGLEISEGKIIFPAVTFDLQASRIELNEESERVFDPKISLTSTYELLKDDYPQLSRDTTIELEIRGTIDRLRMELKPIRGDLRLSQTSIFLFLLMPQSLTPVESELDVFKHRAQSAALAFTGEVFLRPLTNELQELLEGKTKTRIQFGSTLEPAGVTLRGSWKIGPRIEALGSYTFMSEDLHHLSLNRPSHILDSYPWVDFKIRLLLFDHKPLGPLYIESSFGLNQLLKDGKEAGKEARGGLRLNYRVLPK